MAVLVPLASGKGGVGKTVTAANLSFLLARAGKTTILADLDWGGANAHTVLGVRNTRDGLGSWIKEEMRPLEELVIPLPEPHLHLLPGDGLLPGTVHMPYFRKRRLLKELSLLPADFVILDLGAGTGYNTVDFFLQSGQGYVITTPEPTAILNAYSFLKTCLYRLAWQAHPAHSEGRLTVEKAFCSGPEFHSSANGDAVVTLTPDALCDGDASARERLEKTWRNFVPGIIINMGKTLKEVSHGTRLRQICRRHLDVGVEYLCVLPWEDGVRASILDRTPLAGTDPENKWIQALQDLCDHLVSGRVCIPPPDEGHFADLSEAARDWEP